MRLPNKAVHVFGWGLITLVASGCSMTGHWNSVELAPEIARNDFRLFGGAPVGQDFTRAQIVLSKEGTYSGDAYYGDVVHHSTGTWEQKGSTITFVDDHGPASTYDFDLYDGGNKLKLVRRIEGTDVVLTLSRASS